MVCCRGCSPRSGCLSIACLYLVLSVVGVGFGIWYIEYCSKCTESPYAATIKQLNIIMVGFCVMTFFFNVLLLIGVVKKIPSLLKTWVVFEIMSFIAPFLKMLFSNTNTLQIITGTLSVCFLKIYFLCVVNRHYEELTSQRDAGLDLS